MLRSRSGLSSRFRQRSRSTARDYKTRHAQKKSEMIHTDVSSFLLDGIKTIISACICSHFPNHGSNFLTGMAWHARMVPYYRVQYCFTLLFSVSLLFYFLNCRTVPTVLCQCFLGSQAIDPTRRKQNYDHLSEHLDFCGSFFSCHSYEYCCAVVLLASTNVQKR